MDDYCFFPWAQSSTLPEIQLMSCRYLFGSAQLLGEPQPVRHVDMAGRSLTLTSGGSLTPPESLKIATAQPPPPITDLFTLSLHRITIFKKGAAFSEHSPLLHSLSQFPNWQKPHSGLRKMFMGEVVGKKVVVQGLWVGGWCWGPDAPVMKEELAESMATAGHNGLDVATKAPWVR